MSIDQVQARTAEIWARMQSLSVTAPSGGALGISGTSVPQDTDPSGFAGALADAQVAQTVVSAPVARAHALTGPDDPGTGRAAVSLAREQLGTPYVFGGARPGGFDCSGLVQWTYGKLGVQLPRTSAEQGRAGTAVSPADARPGDLVYMDHVGPVDHIGIYAGDGTMVVAPHTGAVVRVEKVDLSKVTSIRRVTGAAPGPVTTSSGWSRALPAAGRRFAPMIATAAEQAGISPELLASVAWTESGFDPDAVSPAGATGLVQLIPGTAAGLDVDARDPAQALVGGARYLRQQLDAFGGRTDLALAAYNAGPTAVRRAGGVPPIAETRAYVDRVLGHLRSLGGVA